MRAQRTKTSRAVPLRHTRTCCNPGTWQRSSSPTVRPLAPRRRWSESRPHEPGIPVRALKLDEAPAPPADGNLSHPERPQQLTDRNEIDWRRQWFAVRPVVDLPTDRPLADKVLGLDVVVWRDGEGEWRVFEDRCPHRKVALSEGRLEADGTLSCAYHGWRFNGEGSCTLVPQLDPEAHHAQQVLSRPQACAVQFPTAVKHGLLFVWMTSGSDAFLEAARTPVSSMPGPEGDVVTLAPWYCRDMEMCVEVLMENIADPAHVSFSHHGEMDARRERPVKFAVEEVESFGPGGFNLHVPEGMRPGVGMRYEHHFPRMVLMNNIGPGWGAVGVFYFTPLTRNTSRFNHAVFAVPGSSGKIPFPMGMLGFMPMWVSHLMFNRVLDGDAIFLNRQSAELQAWGPGFKDYFNPTPADKGVMELWKMLTKYSPGGVNYYRHVASPEILPRTETLNRFAQHTAQCKACMGVLNNIIRLRWLLLTASAAGFVIAVCQALLKGPASIVSTPVAALVCLLGAAGAAVLSRLETEFTFADYVHQDH